MERLTKIGEFWFSDKVLRVNEKYTEIYENLARIILCNSCNYFAIIVFNICIYTYINFNFQIRYQIINFVGFLSC